MPNVVILAGGTGGAKLARGMLDVVGAGGSDLTVIANTGDDIEIHGAHVSPDPDLCLFWLADRIDERGWGLRGDTFNAMDGLRELGADVWFSLGDRDLAIGLRRAQQLRDGMRLTQALLALGSALGVGAAVLPMADEPVRTWVRTNGSWRPFQEFMIVDRAEGLIEDVRLRGMETATVPPEALRAIAAADAIVVGPSNPVISIGPILAVPGMREALRASGAPVVAVSPIVDGQVVKGPTAQFMAWAKLPLSAEGVAAHLGDLLDGIVADEPVAALPSHATDTMMAGASARERVARETLDFALSLR